MFDSGYSLGKGIIGKTADIKMGSPEGQWRHLLKMVQASGRFQIFSNRNGKNEDPLRNVIFFLVSAGYAQQGVTKVINPISKHIMIV